LDYAFFCKTVIDYLKKCEVVNAVFNGETEFPEDIASIVYHKYINSGVYIKSIDDIHKFTSKVLDEADDVMYTKTWSYSNWTLV
jgi:pyruvate/2-oxoglutarate dehydrogenase complex dihydrolipoamide acyltransferase (E2) component